LHVFCTLSRSQLFLLRGSYTYRSTGVCLMRSPTLARFAEPYRLRLKRDNCGESIINGKFGHLYEHAAGLLGLVLEESRNGRSKSRSLLARRHKASAAGFRVHQAGEVETILLFEVGSTKGKASYPACGSETSEGSLLGTTGNSQASTRSP
jgi:hypothetical protein